MRAALNDGEARMKSTRSFILDIMRRTKDDDDAMSCALIDSPCRAHRSPSTSKISPSASTRDSRAFSAGSSAAWTSAAAIPTVDARRILVAVPVARSAARRA